jgi:hypothetical protein
MVIEVQLVGRSTDDALATIALPDFQLDGGWNDAPRSRTMRRGQV